MARRTADDDRSPGRGSVRRTVTVTDDVPASTVAGAAARTGTNGHTDDVVDAERFTVTDRRGDALCTIVGR